MILFYEVMPMKRILLKLSGEALAGKGEHGINESKLKYLVNEVIKVKNENKFIVGIVIGGGNFVRGSQLPFIKRMDADYMGMMSTVVNGLALKSAFEMQGIESTLFSGLNVAGLTSEISTRLIEKSIKNGNFLIFTGGTGNPFFTTDTAAVLRGLQMKAEIIIKATKVNGVYDKDPEKFSDAVRYSTITYSEALARDLRIMDATAIALAREEKIPIKVINFFEPDTLVRTLNGEDLGTLVE